MITPKIILYKHKTYTDGTHPIIIQVIINSKAVRKVIGRCLTKDWLDSKARVSSRHLEAPRLNNAIDVALRDYGLDKSHNLQSLFKDVIANFKINKQVSRHNTYEVLLNQLIKFSPNVDFKDVDKSFIFKFANFLSKPPIKNNENTIHQKMVAFSSAMRQARKKKIIHENPFDDLSFPSSKSRKSKMSVSEMRMFIEAELLGNQDLCRDIFLTCIYLRGSRIGDVICLTGKNLIDGRLDYKEMKTGKVRNMAIGSDLMGIIEKWSGKSKFGYIFPLIRVPVKTDIFVFKAECKNIVSLINWNIKHIAKLLGIEKNISTHTARHSFSKLANEVISNTSVTKDLVGHSSLDTHEGYISEISDNIEMDGYAKLVLDKLKPSSVTNTKD